MKMIKEIREFYGFPQSILAQYLGISRGHLAMAKTGKRDLQTELYLQLNKFASAIYEQVSGATGTIIKKTSGGILPQKSLLNYSTK